jgi:hypothetical protein
MDPDLDKTIGIPVLTIGTVSESCQITINIGRKWFSCLAFKKLQNIVRKVSEK